MKQAKDLAKAIGILAGKRDVLMATVASVNKGNASCDVLIDGDEFGAFRLQAVIKQDVKGCKLFPAEGSKVAVQQMNDNGEWMIVLFSEIEEVLFETGNCSIRMNNDGIVLNGGTLGGMVKLTELVQQLNKLEQSVNQLKTVFATWVVVPTDGGAALKTAVGAWAGQMLTPTTANDVMNDKVKQ